MKKIMVSALKILQQQLIGLVILFLLSQAYAGEPILIGQSASFNGPFESIATEFSKGAELYFNELNKNGGINGRPIKLIALDDGYKPERAVENTQILIEKHKVFAMFGIFGTGTTQAVLPIIAAQKVPLFAPYSGADSLRDDNNRYLFHVRPPYSQEMIKIVRQLVATGIREIGIVYQEDNFGNAARLAALDGLKSQNLTPSVVASFDIKKLDVEPAVQKTQQKSPPAIIMCTSGEGIIAFAKAYKKQGGSAQFFTLSVSNNPVFLKKMGDEARGISIAQVIPSPSRTSLPVVKEYRDALSKKGSNDYSYTGLDGFISAKIFAEGLKRMRPPFDREALIKSLESLKEYDAGGMIVSFGEKKRTGSNYVDLSIVGKDGTILR